MKSKFNLFFPCYYAFFVNGAMVLLVGSILPYIIKEAGISYSTAGGFLSAFAIGNLLASFVFPALTRKIGHKKTIVFMTALIPISFGIISLIPPVPVIYCAFVVAGAARGSVSIINNAIVNDNTGGRPAALNLLHMTFACGAFLAPFLTSVYVAAGLGWRGIVYTIMGATALACIFYACMNMEDKSAQKNTTISNDNKDFLKNIDFYIVGIILFLYLGLENCVNGWFVTYFKDMGIMSDTYAATLVSITWIMVMLGRLLTAALSKKIHKTILIFAYCIATAAFFILLISTSNLTFITIAIVGLGFFFAGIYPTSVSSVGPIVKGSTTAMSVFLAIAALGGIITPKIVGIAADKKGMIFAIMLLLINVIGMLILSFINYMRNKNR